MWGGKRGNWVKCVSCGATHCLFFFLFFFVLPQEDTEVRLPESPERNTEVKYLLKRLGSGCTGCVRMCVQVEEVISYFYTAKPLPLSCSENLCSLLQTIILAYDI